MPINSRSKGQRGEREVVHLLNATIQRVLDSQTWPEDVVKRSLSCIQRNQNQSAVGGADLVGVFGISIEVKRQETLHINKWWEQCVAQAARNNEWPVLLYRSNNQPWRCVTRGILPLPGGKLAQNVTVQIDESDFFVWFYQWVYYKMSMGELPPC